MESTRAEFERKSGYIRALLGREKSGKYRSDYLNAKWYGFLLARGITTEPNKA